MPTSAGCSGVPDLGPLLASGRDADVFAYGPDLVVRRSRIGRSMEREARVMSYLAGHGYPSPRVEAVRADGSELVMERIAGPTMLQVLSRRPWTLGDNAARLATLHRRLHEIPAPDWLSPFPDGGEGIVHLDLHPLNVILSPRGPVLIDWTNVARGAGPHDVRPLVSRPLRSRSRAVRPSRRRGVESPGSQHAAGGSGRDAATRDERGEPAVGCALQEGCSWAPARCIPRRRRRRTSSC